MAGCFSDITFALVSRNSQHEGLGLGFYHEKPSQHDGISSRPSGAITRGDGRGRCGRAAPTFCIDSEKVGSGVL